MIKSFVIDAMCYATFPCRHYITYYYDDGSKYETHDNAINICEFLLNRGELHNYPHFIQYQYNIKKNYTNRTLISYNIITLPNPNSTLDNNSPTNPLYLHQITFSYSDGTNQVEYQDADTIYKFILSRNDIDKFPEFIKYHTNSLHYYSTKNTQLQCNLL